MENPITGWLVSSSVSLLVIIGFNWLKSQYFLTDLAEIWYGYSKQPQISKMGSYGYSDPSKLFVIYLLASLQDAVLPLVISSKII